MFDLPKYGDGICLARLAALLEALAIEIRSEVREKRDRLSPIAGDMNVIGNPGIEKDDFELFSLAVSAMNGCGMCIDAHDKVVRDHGITAEYVVAVGGAVPVTEREVRGRASA